VIRIAFPTARTPEFMIQTSRRMTDTYFLVHRSWVRPRGDGYSIFGGETTVRDWIPTSCPCREQ